MKRLSLLVVALVAMATPAHADHGASTRSWTQRTIVLEDRTGVQLVRDTAALVASRWNASGANFTITYRDGPATNACGPEGNVVSICEQTLSGDALGQTNWYLDGPTTMAAAWILLSPGTVHGIGTPNIRAVLAHEVGHAICCDHSQAESIMNTLWGASTDPAAGPVAHDFEVLRMVYGAAVPTGSRYLTAGDGQVADVPTGSTSVALVTMHPRASTSNQRWNITANGAGYRLVNAYSAKVFTAMGDGPTSTIAQWVSVANGDYQRWAIESSGTGFRLRNLTTGLCADTSGSSVIINTCNGSTTQTWSIV